MASVVQAEANTTTEDHDRVVRQLQQVIGIDHVLTDEADRRFYSTDLSFRPGKIAAVVVQP